LDGMASPIYSGRRVGEGMEHVLGKRGRKMGRGNVKIHRAYGPEEVRLHMLAATASYPVLFRCLTDAMYKADLDRTGYRSFIKALGAKEEPPYHPATRDLQLWVCVLGLQDTSWALLLAGRVVWKALQAPPEYRYSPVLWGALSVAHRLRFHQEVNELYMARLRALLAGEDMEFAPAREGFRPPVTRDFPPNEVAEWLAWRLVECQKARARGKRLPGWTALAKRLEGVEHRTVEHHVLALAKYSGVPTTLLT